MPTVSSSPEATPRLRRELVHVNRTFWTVALAISFALIAGLTGAKPAAAYWHAIGTAGAAASVATLLPPSNVSVPASSNSNIAVSWTGSAGTVVPTGYYVTRITGSTVVAACGSSPNVPVASTSCTDTSVPEGTHRYQVTAVHRSWSAAGPVSGSVTVTSLRDLSFESQPSTTVTAGSTLGTLQVQLRTIFGVAVWQDGVPVTISIGANPGGGVLSGTATAYTNWSGTATFSGLSINKAGAGYTLIASSPGYAGIASHSFAIAPAAASKLLVSGGSTLSGTASSAALLGPVTVQRQDAYGNAVTAGTSVVSLASNSAGMSSFSLVSNGAKVSTATIAAGSSTASFFYGDTKAGTSLITAISSGLTPPPPVTATIAAAPAGKLQFDAIAAVVLKNTTITPAVTVHVSDAFGNPAESTLPVVVHSNCSVKGTLTAVPSSGAASFPDLQIAGKASNCRLTATLGVLTAESASFNSD